MKKYLLLFVCLLVTTWAGAQTTFGTESTLTINGTSATLHVGTAGDFSTYYGTLSTATTPSTTTLAGITTLTITGSPNADDYSKVGTAFTGRTSTTFPNSVITTKSSYAQTSTSGENKTLVRVTGAVGDFLSTALTGYNSYDKLEVAGALSTTDFATLKTLAIPTIKLSEATFATGTTESAISFANNTSVKNIILPMGLSAIDASWFTGCTNLNAAVSHSIYADKDPYGNAVSDAVKLTGYVQTAGSLRTTLYEYCSGKDNTELGSINLYGYSLNKVYTVALSGNLLACDIAKGPQFISADGHTDPSGSSKGIAGILYAHAYTVDLTNAVFATQEDMNFNYCIGDSHLRTVYLPISKSMTTIPDRCFNIGGLVMTSLCIPGNYTTIGTHVFENDNNLAHFYTTGVDADGNGDLSKVIDKGVNTITLPAGLTSIGTAAFNNVTKITDVYCLATKAPKCAVDAFDAASRYGNNGHNATYPITRASYTNGNKSFAILHYPTGIGDEEKNYTDVDRVYSVTDELQTTDVDGNILVWPNQLEYDKAESQAYAGQTWKAWGGQVYGNGVLMSLAEVNAVTPALTTDATQTYNADYTGWHQFVLAGAYDYENPDKPHWNFNKIKDNNWWTICVPFDLTKSQLLTMFGDNTATKDDAKYPNVCTLTKVIRDADSKIIRLCFGENLETDAATDETVVIKAGYPYMIKPNMLEAKSGHTYTPSNHIFTYKAVTSTTALLPSYDADNEKSTVNMKGTAAGDGFKYRFIGSYVKKEMPAHGFYLGWDTNTSSAVYYYQGTTASKNKSWNAYTCIVGANMNVTSVEKSGTIENNNYKPAHLDITCASDLFESNGAKVGIIFDDESTPTKINGVAFDNAAANEVTGKVYNMNGQQVRTNGSFDGLNKGVYIMNGKKYVVK